MKRIDSPQNARAKQWKKLLTKKERDKSGLFLVEGFHLVEEALKADVVRELIISESVEVPHGWDTRNAELYLVSEALAKGLSDTEAPQGIFAVCGKPEADILVQDGRFLLLDGVQDPGNLGTMIRTADAAGLTAVILGEGTVDLYNSKVLRSTQGSLFHLPVIKGRLEDWVHKLRDNGVAVYGTALEGAVPFTEAPAGGSFALIMGNEGSGVRPELLGECDRSLYIPIHGAAESLNVAVAAGILTYYLRG
ncbi:TrmH family RNA methyltransferase [Ectobacillus ponti]|uniref:RNA methyltransferase n=1 Tax=Ectobacillus ponti TaxID=2961894 RepID=A0AA41X295_9BACI|nr:RNA methyltransferase [Ectobacillus ponti]MCP8967402.1 RNA methyltransferase [Ectobacillus ponti]